MKDLLTQDGKPQSDLSKRMADNLVEALVDWLQEPSPRKMDQVYLQSTALQSLATLAIAEQLQKLALALTEPGEFDEEAL
mgnify:FL=1